MTNNITNFYRSMPEAKSEEEEKVIPFPPGGKRRGLADKITPEEARRISDFVDEHPWLTYKQCAEILNRSEGSVWFYSRYVRTTIEMENERERKNG